MTKKNTPSKNSFRPRSRAMALEPRVLFDGAAVIAGADFVGASKNQYTPELDLNRTVAATTTVPKTAEVNNDKTLTLSAVESAVEKPVETSLNGTDSGAVNALVVIDSRVSGYQSLLDSLPSSTRVIVVSEGQSGLDAVSAALKGGGNFKAVHIFSHGTEGSFTLGDDTVNMATLNAQKSQFEAWGKHLTAGADILIYGCEVAKGEKGSALVSTLAEITKADVAASTNLTGSAAKGGDWVLETQTGFIEASSLESAARQLGLSEALAAATITDTVQPLVRTMPQGSSATIAGISIADSDALNSQTVTITASTGTITLAGGATPTGLTLLTGNGTGSISFTASATDATAALNGMTFTPASSFFNDGTHTTLASLVITSNDGSATSNLTTSVLVTPINHAPDMTTKTPALTFEGGTVALGLAQLASSEGNLDVDIANNRQVIQQLMTKIDSLPTKGTLSYNGSVLVIGSSVPVTDIQAGKVTYKHNGTDLTANDTDSFNLTIDDGAEGVRSGTIDIIIAPKNFAPTITGALEFIEGQVKALNPTISWGDAFDNWSNAISVEISNLQNGSQGKFFWDANANGVSDTGEEFTNGGNFTLSTSGTYTFASFSMSFKYWQDETEPNWPAGLDGITVTSPSYSISVKDAGGGAGSSSALTGTSNITLSIVPNNDDPTLLNAHATSGTALGVVEAQKLVLTSTMLKISDADRRLSNLNETTPIENLVYTIETRPTEGEIQLNVGTGGPANDGWVVLGKSGRFTQADLEAGKVRYYQTTNVADSPTITPDGFTFTVRDSAFGYNIFTNPVTDGREGGLRDTPAGVIANQSFYFNITGLSTADPRAVGVTTSADYQGVPRDPTPNYGAIDNTTMTYLFTPWHGMTNTNLVSGADWQEANVNAGVDDYLITEKMLAYQIQRQVKNSSDVVIATLDLPASETVYTITSNPTNGTIQTKVSSSWKDLHLNGQFTQKDIDDGKIRFVSDGSEIHSSTFNYKVSDGTTHHYDGVFSIGIKPTNDRPSGNAGSSVTVREGNGSTDAASRVRLGAAAIGMSDADGSLLSNGTADATKRLTQEGQIDFLWFKPTSLPAETNDAAKFHGQLQRWNGSAWVDVTTTEWLPQSLLTTAVDGETSGLRYLHDDTEPLTYAGGAQVSFKYLVRDDLAAPSGSVFVTDTSTPTNTTNMVQGNQSEEVTAVIKIITVNDPPAIADKPADSDPTVPATITDGGALVGVNEILVTTEGSQTVITPSLLTAVDPDSTTIQRQYVIKGLPATGSLILNGSILGVGTSFTQQDIMNGKLSYKHNGTEIAAPVVFPGDASYNDKFHFIISDAVVYDGGTGALNYNTFLIQLASANDRPVVTAPTAPIVIDSLVPANNPVSGFSVTDPDLDNGIQTGETEFLQATVRILNKDGTPIANYATEFPNGASITSSTLVSSSVTVLKTGNATDKILQIQGTKAQVNAALAGLTVTFNDDLNKDYQIQVIADDRLRDSVGALTNTTTPLANGGTVNQEITPGAGTLPVPNTVYDWATTVTVPSNDSNIDAKTVAIRASTVNELPTLTGTPANVVEDALSKINSTFVVSDPESAGFGTNVVVTLSVPSGKLDVGNGTAGVDTSVSGVTVAGDTTGTVTLTGKASDIQTVLNNSLYYQTAPHINHDLNGGAVDGDVTLTVKLDDTNSKYGSDVGAGSQPNNPADLLVPIAILEVNDAPTITNALSATAVAISAAAPKDANGFIDVTGFVIADVDDTDGSVLNVDPSIGEADFIQATVRLLPATGTIPLDATQHQEVNFASSTVGTAVVDSTLNGVGKALVVRGTLAEVKTYIAGLQIKVSDTFSNTATNYRVQVVVDDRLRTATAAGGALDGSDKANGGLNSDGAVGTANVPPTAIDPYADAPVLAQNVSETTRLIKVNSLINQNPSFTDLGKTPISGVTQISFIENGAMTLIDGDANAVLNDPELVPLNNWENAVLTVERDGGANADDSFSFTTSPIPSVATFTNTGGRLQITFSSSVTNDSVNGVLRSITYRNTNNNPPSSVVLKYVINDGDTDADRANNPQGVNGPLTGVADVTNTSVKIIPTNDPPVVTAPVGPINIDSATANASLNKVLTFSVTDVDLPDSVPLLPGQPDFLQVTVRLLDSSGTPIADYTNVGTVGGSATFGYANQSGGLWAVTKNGLPTPTTGDGILQFQGTRAQVKDALAGLTVTFANDQNAIYKIQVIADDRLRDVNGAFAPTTDYAANGGKNNQATTVGGADTAVPTNSSTDEYNWATNIAVSSADPKNIHATTVDLRASLFNNPPTFNGGSTVSVLEDVRTSIGSGYTVVDTESTAFGLPIKVTLSVPTGHGTLDVAGTGAQTTFTPSGGSAVTVSGDGTNTVVLTGLPADIQALLNARNSADTAADANGGLYYTSPTTPVANINHDLNGADAGDVTLITAFDEQTAAIGDDVGSGSVAKNPSNITTAITIEAVNDAPTVSNIATPLTIAGNTATAVPGFVIADVDSDDGYVTGETDGVIQATVRLLNSSGTPLASNVYDASATTGKQISLTTSATGHGATVDTTYTGVEKALVLRGTLTQINAYLADLQVTFANSGVSNVDANYSVEVIADDRLRVAADGAFTVPANPLANGGAKNQETGTPAVPATNGFDPYSSTTAGYDAVFNIAVNTRPLFISTYNDPGQISASVVSTNEKFATIAINSGNANITLADPDSNGANTMVTTVTVDKGTITAAGAVSANVTGLGTTSITITGETQAQINARLQALALTFPPAQGVDWNGVVNITVVYDDKGNTGMRPPSLTGDTNAPAANSGDYDYVDGSSNHLKTTRTVAVTINPVNDAPTRTAATTTLLATAEDVAGGTGTTPPGDTVANLFGPRFSDAKDNVPSGSSPNTLAGVAITANNAASGQGTWQYSTDGNTWNNLSTTMTTATAVLLKDTDKVRFVPAANYFGTPGTLVARLVETGGTAITSGNTVDVTTSGGSTRYSTSSNAVTLDTTVTALNDRPTITASTITAVNEDATNPAGVLVSALSLTYSDSADNQDAVAGHGVSTATNIGGIAIVGNAATAAQGVWQYKESVGAWTDIPTSGLSDSAAIVLPTTATVRFLPNVSNYNGSVGSLTIRAADTVQTFSASSDISAATALQTDTWSVTNTLGTSVTRINDEPVLAGTAVSPIFTFTGGVRPLVVGDNIKLLNGSGVTDIDLTTTPGLNGTTLGAGKLTITLTNGIAGDVVIADATKLTAAAGTTAAGGTGNTPYVVTLGNGATLAQVQDILDSLQYTSTASDPTNVRANMTRAYTIVLSDGNNVQAGGNAGGPTALDSNQIGGTITLIAENTPGNISAANVTVDEGSATVVLDASNGNISIADPDAMNATTMVTTVSVSKGTITGVGGAGGTATIAGDGSSVTITGATQAEINSRLKALTVTLPTTSAEWNGSFDVTVVYNDQGNTGIRPGTLLGVGNQADTNAPAANPGDYSYADTAGGSTDSKLVTTRTLTVNVTAVNNAPKAVDTTPVTLTATTEDTNNPTGSTVSTLFTPKFTDTSDTVSGGSSANTLAGVAITTNNSVPTQGVWQYSTDGATWTDLPAVSTSNPLLLKSADSVRFVPAGNFFGTPGGLETRLIDNSGGAVTTGVAAVGTYGGITPYSSDVVVLQTSVNPLNDRPSIVNTTLISIAEDTVDPAGETISSLGLTYSDTTDDQSGIAGGNDGSTPIGGIAIVGNGATTAQGVWQYDNGSGWVAVGTPSDTAAVVLPTSAKLRFLPAGDYNGTPPNLTIRATDSTPATFGAGVNLGATVDDQSSTWSATKTVGTIVTPVNDKPATTHLATSPTVTENSSTGTGLSIDPVALLDAIGAVTDVDPATTPTLTSGVFGAGTITVTLTDGIAGDVLQVSGTLPAGVSVAGGLANNALVITLDNDTTIAEVKALLEAVQYKNTSDNPAVYGTDTTRSYTVVLNDGNNIQPNGGSTGNAGGPTALSAPVINGTITLSVVNDPPTAIDDTHAVTEDSGIPSTGNAIQGTGSPNSSAVDSDPDNVIADLSLSGIRTGTEVAGGGMTAITAGTDSTNGTVIVGTYGTLTIGADGTYSYDLDNTNPTVNALLTGQTLTDVFAYTLRDPDNQTDVAQLTITINGVSDGGALAITPVDGNAAAAGHATVREGGLTTVANTTEITTGQVIVTAPEGIKEITIGGTTFTVAQLNSFTPASPSAAIDTGEGLLQVTGITILSGSTSAPKNAEVNYTYTLKAPVPKVNPGDVESADTIALTVKDNSSAGTTANGNLVVQILEDIPTAKEDANEITKGMVKITGNAFTGVPDAAGADRMGADVTPTPVSAIAGGTLGTPVNGTYGTLTIAADGSYTYTLDNTNSVVAGLQSGQKRTDEFTYTITDSDGDTSSTTITITINGVTPNDVPIARDDAFNGKQEQVVTGSLKDNDKSSSDGGNTWAKTTNPSHGTVVVNADGTFIYTPDAGWSGVDTFTYTLMDGDGDKSTATVTITVNGVPKAVSDNLTTPKDTPLTGTVSTNDKPSPDGGHVWKTSTTPAHGTVTLNADGTFTYIPDAGHVGTDTFTYTITDKDGDSSTTTVTITVTDKKIPVIPKPEPAPEPEPETPPQPEPEPVPSNPVPVPTNPIPVPQPQPEPEPEPEPTLTPTPNVPVPKPTPDEQDTVPMERLQPKPQTVPRPTEETRTVRHSIFMLEQGREPSVLRDTREVPVARLPVPFHPIVYVNDEVEHSQAMREVTDHFGLGDWRGLDILGSPEVPLRIRLSIDPAVWVHHAVVESQGHGALMRGIANGYLGRLNLTANHRLEVQGPTMPDEDAKPTENEPSDNKEGKDGKEVQGDAKAGTENVQQLALAEKQKPDAAKPTQGRASLSFTSQLQRGANRLPLQARR